jgi:hypothetical protein
MTPAETPGTVLEKDDPKFVFESGDVLGHGGLRKVERLSGLLEVTVPDDGEEDTQLAQFEGLAAAGHLGNISRPYQRSKKMHRPVPGGSLVLPAGATRGPAGGGAGGRMWPFLGGRCESHRARTLSGE